MSLFCTAATVSLHSDSALTVAAVQGRDSLFQLQNVLEELTGTVLLGHFAAGTVPVGQFS